MKRAKAFIGAIVANYGKDNTAQLAGSLAFFTALAMAPLLIIMTAIAGFIFGTEAAQQELVGRAREVAGPEAAEIVKTALENAAEPGAGIIALLIGVAGLLFGASNIFVQLQLALNRIWGVAANPDQALRATIGRRLSALLYVVGAGLVLIALLLVGALMSTLRTALADSLPGAGALWTVIDAGVSLALYTVIFAMIFKILPRAEIAWHDVWLGALVTAVLFTVGKFLLSWYLGGGTMASVYGAAGSLLVVLIWIYYTSQILFFGAQFTQVYARVRGRGIKPQGDAVLLHEAEQRQRADIDKQVGIARGGTGNAA